VDVVVKRGCGLDVHQAFVVAHLFVELPNGKLRKSTQKFSTFRKHLVELAEWLKAEGCTHVAMESTGTYWVPVYGVLEQFGEFELVLGNAQHMKNVPGRKTDVKDAEWIGQLLRHGLIRKSYVPEAPLRELRMLLRYRRGLVEAQSQERNRLLKLLETANIKLSSVASDVFGVSGMLMLQALADGKTTVAEMAELAKGVLRKKLPDLLLALDGNFGDHHRFVIKVQLERLKVTARDLTAIDLELATRLAPYKSQMDALAKIPGVQWLVAATIVAELGPEVTHFQTVHHAASWAGVCPGNNESAGKRLGNMRRKGNVYLTTALVQAAHAASRTKGTYFRDKFHRLKTRRGHKRAAMAIAHKILTAAYFVLRGDAYSELGEQYLDVRESKRTTKHLVKRLERLGYAVTLEKGAAA
jgi:transposase